jgi:hypothetical protein
VFALLAGVEVESALRALSDWIGQILQQRAAFGAAGDGARPGHVHGPRAECVLFFWSGWLVEFFFRSRARILVSALPIFAIGQKAPPEDVSFSAFGAGGTRGSLVRTRRTHGQTGQAPSLHVGSNLADCGAL